MLLEVTPSRLQAQAGAVLESRGRIGNTALHSASESAQVGGGSCDWSQVEMMKELVDRGLSLDERNARWERLLLVVCPQRGVPGPPGRGRPGLPRRHQARRAPPPARGQPQEAEDRRGLHSSTLCC